MMPLPFADMLDYFRHCHMPLVAIAFFAAIAAAAAAFLLPRLPLRHYFRRRYAADIAAAFHAPLHVARYAFDSQNMLLLIMFHATPLVCCFYACHDGTCCLRYMLLLHGTSAP